MAVFFHDPARRIVTPLSIDLQRRTIKELTAVATSARIHEQPAGHRQQGAKEYQQHQDDAHQSEYNLARKMLTAERIMTPNAITLHEHAHWSDAKQLFERHGIHHLFIVDDDQALVGLLSERDILVYPDPTQNFAAYAQLPVKPLTTATPDTAVALIAFLMLEKGIDALGVATGTHLNGIITQRDLLKVFLQPTLLERWA
jgi:acetoin utilization protein AcuB